MENIPVEMTVQLFGDKLGVDMISSQVAWASPPHGNSPTSTNTDYYGKHTLFFIAQAITSLALARKSVMSNSPILSNAVQLMSP